ncbi:MAG: NADH-quinone oxidoreductase subunit A [Magnetococcus sp. WYHC-3]
MEHYFGVLMLLLVAVAVAVGMYGGSYLLGVKRPYNEKRDQYECGFEPIGRPYARFDIRFYLIAILFIVFDLEAAFLYPWAVAFRDIGWIGFVEMMLFLAVLLVGYIYAWRKGALEWE